MATSKFVANKGQPRPSAPARKPTPVTTRKTSVKAEAAAVEDSETSFRREVFAANLPRFHVDSLRGNVVADGETFTSKAGETYYTFRIAYNRMRNGEKHVMFIKVLQKEDPNATEAPVSKGNYVEVSGDYSDDGVSPGREGYEPSVFRTIFVGPEDSVKVLIG